MSAIQKHKRSYAGYLGAVAASTSPPLCTSPPTITGTAQVGQTLTGSTGTWTGNPEIVFSSLRWLADDAVITGATGLTYVPKVEDIGKAIKFSVTASNSRGDVDASSDPTSPVIAA